MTRFMIPGAVLLTLASLAASQSNKQSKPEPTTILAAAQSIFVEPYLGPTNEGSIYDPRVNPDDRDAVTDVLDAIQKWGHYRLAFRRSEADIVVFVRKGRLASPLGGVHVDSGHPSPSNPTHSGGPGEGTLNGVEAGPNEDLFWVYSRNPEGKLIGPIWQESLKDGLKAPQLVLFQKFKDDVNTSIAELAKKKALAKKSSP
jgi:hypothetical protein